MSSSAFAAGAELPRRYTCDGAGEEPAVRAADVPPDAGELVLVVSDPDAPGGTYVHLTQDQCYPPDLPAKSAQRPGAEVATLDAGHMAMVTIPDQVAGILNKLAG